MHPGDFRFQVSRGSFRMALYRTAQELLQARLNRRSLLAGAGATAALAATGLNGTYAQDASPVAVDATGFKAAFIYIGPVGDLGWTYSHDQGRLELEANLPGIATSYLESVPESQADAERAIRG